MFNLDDRLKTYADIIDFIKGYKENKKITKQSISNLKNRKLIFKSVPRTPETLDFVEYVKKTFENFDVDSFLARGKVQKVEKVEKGKP